jgi:hypothetical protein
MALDRGDVLSADELDRDPELKLGPAANSMERRENAAAEREGREYVPVTERGAVTHAARQARMAFQDMRERLDLARETYGMAREEGQGRVSAGLAALRAAVDKDRSGERAAEDVRERLAQIIDRGREREDAPEPEAGGGKTARDRLKGILNREALDTPQATSHKLDGHNDREQGVEPEPKPSIRKRLDDVLNKPREKLEIEDEREVESEKEIDNEHEIDREVDRDRGLSH